MNHEFYMQLALKEAELAYEKGEIPVGAVLVSPQRILAKTHNQTELLGDVTAHAEILAITAGSEALGSKYLTNCSLYITLEPCVMCAGALAWAQLSNLVFAVSDNKRGYSSFQPNILHPKTKVITGILEEPCKELLQNFFRRLRN